MTRVITILVIFFITVSCISTQLSEEEIQTAIAKTIVAYSTNAKIETPTQFYTTTSTITIIPTITLTPSLTLSPTITSTRAPTQTPVPTPTITPLSVVTIINNMYNLNEAQFIQFCKDITGARINWTLRIESINRGSTWKYPDSFTLVLDGYEEEWLGIWLINLSPGTLSRYKTGDLISFTAIIRSCQGFLFTEISLFNPTFSP